ncbi:serine/threonine-protein kinase RsbW [Paenibacillus algorifonticola]|uniref:Serine/threonine-protein kinase RsbW n=1 Tax=Paenibacillus algorifonticola TaxID=684063 RepID=A0A1I2EY76_9BACL|nr:serine/threonine-protein kinase RsbW [Paenibacillus algorifonticola]
MQIPADAQYLDIVRLGLYGIASKMGFSYEDIEDMKVAVGEACNNAVLHYMPDQAVERESADAVQAAQDELQITVEFEVLPDSLTIKITNSGAGFEADAYMEKAGPLEGEDASGLEVGGLGLYLMQALMDEVNIHSAESTQVVMTKRLLPLQ